MPDMDGPELLEQGRRKRPQLPALFTTGMASDQELRRWRSKGQPIVAKPWKDAQLRDTIHRLLSLDNPVVKRHD
jgi:CheY-like chemotaxis protein